MVNEVAPVILVILVIAIILFFSIAKEYWYSKYWRRPTKRDRYRELLKTEEWRDKRSDIIQKHNCKCDWCGKTYDLQVHHKYYLRRKNGYMVDPWLYNDNCFMVLCSRCHNRYHKKYKVRTFTIE